MTLHFVICDLFSEASETGTLNFCVTSVVGIATTLVVPLCEGPLDSHCKCVSFKEKYHTTKLCVTGQWCVTIATILHSLSILMCHYSNHVAV